VVTSAEVVDLELEQLKRGGVCLDARQFDGRRVVGRGTCVRGTTLIDGEVPELCKSRVDLTSRRGRCVNVGRAP